MLGKHADESGRGDRFAVVENTLHDDDRPVAAPTALLRLKAAIAAEAAAQICLSAVADLRAAAGSEVAERRDLTKRSNLLEEGLRNLARDHADDSGARIQPRPELPGARTSTIGRSSFRLRLARVLGSRAAPPTLAVLRIGIGSMEDIAVALGSAAVDQLLEIVADRIAHAVRAGDAVTQLDLEEFACVILDLPGREQLTHIACKVLDLLSAPMQLGDRQVAFVPNIGIAMCPADGTTPDELIRTAGHAMRRARDQESRYAFSDAHAEIWASQFCDLTER